MKHPPPLLTEYRNPKDPVKDLAAAVITIVDFLIVLGCVGIVAAGVLTVLLTQPLETALEVIGVLVLAVLAFCVWSARSLR